MDPKGVAANVTAQFPRTQFPRSQSPGTRPSRNGVDSGGPKLRFWGVRGSHPVSGPEYVAFGGATACIEVRNLGARLIVDGGSGLAALGREADWDAGASDIHLLLTHLHHDHVLGLPFFKPAYRKETTLHLWCGNLGGETAEEALGRMFSPPLFPFRLDQLPAKVIHHGFRAGETIEVAGQAVRTALLNHPSGATGYRFDGEDGSAAIVTDIEHQGEMPDPAVTELCQGVHTLVYDTMMQECEYGPCKGWGHSTVSAAVALQKAAGARRLIGFHHAPHHTDAVMAERETELAALSPGGTMAREGVSIVCAEAAAVG